MQPSRIIIVDDDSKQILRVLAAASAGDETSEETIQGAEMSFSAIRQALCQALTASSPQGGDVVDIYPDRCVVKFYDSSNKLWEIPYTITDGAVTFGDKKEVRKEIDYVAVTAAARLTAAAEGSDGYRWQIRILQPGPDKQGLFDYLPATVKAAAPAYEGAKVFALSQGQHADPKNPYGKSVRDLVGWISNVTPGAQGLEGTLHILKTASWLRDQLVELEANNRLDLLGLSHDVQGQVAKARGAGPRPVERIVKVDSVDVVYDPIAGGKILRMAAARSGQKEDDMSLEKLLAALKAVRPDVYQVLEPKITAGTVTEEDVNVAIAAAGPMASRDDGRIAAAVQTALAANKTEVDQVLNQARVVACGSTLTEELRASKLPAISVTKLRRQFEGKVFETEVLKAAIKEEQEYLDVITGSGTVSGSGMTRIGNEEPEKIQAAFDKMLGVQTDERFSDVRPLQGLRAAYVFLTGDEEVTGRPDRMSRDGIKAASALMEMMRMPAAYNSVSFTYALGNSMYRRLVQDYREVNYYEDILISTERNARDFRTIEAILISYPGDLPDVDPETGDFQEEAEPQTDSEVSYNVNQKGRIITVTRRTIINDDLMVIQRILSRRGRASRRTFAKRIWNKFILNATYKGDNKAIFHSDHGNLGAVTLTNDATGIATLTNRKVAMFNQTEPGSGEKLGLRPRYLVGPVELESPAYALNQPWPLAGTINPNAGLFGQNNERIITHPLFTDVNDWMLVADKREVEIVEVAYLNGQKEPELFVADNPLVGQMFVADKIQYKERHEYEAEVVDYRGVDKSVAG